MIALRHLPTLLNVDVDVDEQKSVDLSSLPKSAQSVVILRLCNSELENRTILFGQVFR